MSPHDEEPGIPPPPRWYGPGRIASEHTSRQDPIPPTEPSSAPQPETEPAGSIDADSQSCHTGGAAEPDRPDTPGQAARAAGRALFGRDLLQPGPGLWPWGARARQRRHQREQARQRSHHRRRELREALYAQQDEAATGSRGWPPVSRSANLRVIITLVTVVAAVVGLGWWATSQPQPTRQAGPPPAPPVTITAAPTPTTPTPAPSPTPSAPELPPRQPVPPGGVAPITPPPAQPGPDPAAVATVSVPAGSPDPAQLSTPESAATAWMRRLCPFDYRAPYGTSQRRARPVMTEQGWSAANPAASERGRASWSQTVTARETGRCTVPRAQVVPEAPRTPSSAIVRISTQRVVTAPNVPAYVEPVTATRIVQRGPDGLWRVGTSTRGG